MGILRSRVNLALALYVLLGPVIALANRPLFILINGGHTLAADFFFGLVSGLGDGLIVAVICAAVMLWHRRQGTAAMVAFAASGLIAQVLKYLVDMPRPPAVMSDVHVLGTALTSHSFPSGHATSLGVLLGLLYVERRMGGRLLWPPALLLFAAAYGRIYGGVHFPLDIWAGLGIGCGCMLLAWRLLRALPPQPWEDAPLARHLPALVLAILAAVLGLGYPVQPATAQPLAPLIALAALLCLLWRWRQLGTQGLF